jgi:hypothetical protein
MVTRITPAKVKAALAVKKAGKLGKKVSAKNLAVFTRQFSVMIDAGLPLVQCLDILGSQEEDKNFAACILQTRTDVESGASLADAMRKHPKTFDPLFTNMVAAGEAGGILDTILKRLATYIEKAVKLQGQVKSAMIIRSPSSSSRARSSASFCGRSSRPSRRCFGDLGSSCRCRRASSSPSATTCLLFPVPGGRRLRHRVGVQVTTRPRRGSGSSTRSVSKPRSSATSSGRSRRCGSAGRSRR